MTLRMWLVPVAVWLCGVIRIHLASVHYCSHQWCACVLACMRVDVQALSDTSGSKYQSSTSKWDNDGYDGGSDPLVDPYPSKYNKRYEMIFFLYPCQTLDTMPRFSGIFVLAPQPHSLFTRTLMRLHAFPCQHASARCSHL